MRMRLTSLAPESWPHLLSWLVPGLALGCGSFLALANSVTVWVPSAHDAFGVDTFVAESVVLWPAGLVLLGAGVIALTATSLVESLRDDARESEPEPEDAVL
ncbi:MAG: hypothetical protein PIR02_01905 [Microbacterium enclense]